MGQGGDDALALKDHHPTLHAEVREAFTAARATAFADDAPADHDHWKIVETDHGRRETRRSWMIRDPEVVAYLLLRQEHTATGGLATKRFRAALDETSLLTVLAGLGKYDAIALADSAGARMSCQG